LNYIKKNDNKQKNIDIKKPINEEKKKYTINMNE